MRTFPALPTVRARASACTTSVSGSIVTLAGRAGDRPAPDRDHDDVVVVGEGRYGRLVPARIALGRPVGVPVLLVERAGVQDQVARDPRDPGLPQARGPLVEDRERIVVVETAGDVGISAPDHQERAEQVAVADVAAPPEGRAELVGRSEIVQRRGGRDHLRDRGDRLGGRPGSSRRRSPPSRDRRRRSTRPRCVVGGRKAALSSAERSVGGCLDVRARAASGDGEEEEGGLERRDADEVCAGRSSPSNYNRRVAL